MAGSACPACAAPTLSPVADLGSVPVTVGSTYATEELAAGSPRGRMTLAVCRSCAHVVNVAFDPTLVAYDSSYELALFHSPTYVQYARDVAADLVGRYDLVGRRVLELGGGGGEFIRGVTALGARGFVSDPGYEVPKSQDGITFLPRLLPEGPERFDFVVARFVLEHVPEPFDLLSRIRELAGPQGIRAFLEVPDAGYDLATAGWDCIYPHVGYFGDVSLRAVAARAGFTVLRSGRAFHDQYLWAELEASPGPVARTEGSVSLAESLATVDSFTPRYVAARDQWVADLGRLADGGARPVLWGAGTRGMTFCNRVDTARRLSAVVDRNPAKHGRFLPVTGHQIISPERVAELGTRAVVVTNPAYRDEVARQLSDLAITADVLVA